MQGLFYYSASFVSLTLRFGLGANFAARRIELTTNR